MPRLAIQNLRVGFCPELALASGCNTSANGANGTGLYSFGVTSVNSIGNGGTNFAGIDKIKSFTIPLTKREIKTDELAISDPVWTTQPYPDVEKPVDGKLIQYLQTSPNASPSMFYWMMYDNTIANAAGNLNNQFFYWHLVGGLLGGNYSGMPVADDIVYNTFGTYPTESKITWEVGKETLIETTLHCIHSRTSVDGIASAPVAVNSANETSLMAFTTSSPSSWAQIDSTNSTLGGQPISAYKIKKIELDVKANYEEDEAELSQGMVYFPVIQGYTLTITYTFLEPYNATFALDKLDGYLQSTATPTGNAVAIVIKLSSPNVTISIPNAIIQTQDSEGTWERKLKEYQTVFQIYATSPTSLGITM